MRALRLDPLRGDVDVRSRRVLPRCARRASVKTVMSGTVDQQKRIAQVCKHSWAGFLAYSVEIVGDSAGAREPNQEDSGNG